MEPGDNRSLAPAKGVNPAIVSRRLGVERIAR
jgi:hypothetical protein